MVLSLISETCINTKLENLCLTQKPGSQSLNTVAYCMFSFKGTQLRELWTNKFTNWVWIAHFNISRYRSSNSNAFFVHLQIIINLLAPWGYKLCTANIRVSAVWLLWACTEREFLLYLVWKYTSSLAPHCMIKFSKACDYRFWQKPANNLCNTLPLSK